MQEHADARLTDFGKEQCATLKGMGHHIENEAQLVVVSPLTRAIETAMLTIGQVRTRGGVHEAYLECMGEHSKLSLPLQRIVLFRTTDCPLWCNLS